MASQEAGAVGWRIRMNGEPVVFADDDSGLIARFLGGDAAAFDALFVRYQTYVYNIIYGIVGVA